MTTRTRMKQPTQGEIAWEQWICSLDARGCVEGKAEGPYLLVRLKRAFEAGWNAREKRQGVLDGLDRGRAK